MLKALKDTPDADDRTMLGAGGALKGGVHLKARNGTPLSNVMLSLLHSVGLDDLKNFGDSEGTFSWE